MIMKKYKYAIINQFAFSDYQIKCTDIGSLENILNGLQKICPECQIKLEKNMAEEPYSVLIEQKGKKKFTQTEIEWWIVKQLCNSGWRPLGEGRYIYEEDY